MGGQYQFNFAGLLGSLPLARSGKLRAIAVTTPKRIPGLDDIPALAESLPGFSVVGWYGVMAPPKLPKPLLNKLHDVIVKILHEPETDQAHHGGGRDAGGQFAGRFPPVPACRHGKVGGRREKERSACRLKTFKSADAGVAKAAKERDSKQRRQEAREKAFKSKGVNSAAFAKLLSRSWYAMDCGIIRPLLRSRRTATPAYS